MRIHPESIHGGDEVSPGISECIDWMLAQPELLTPDGREEFLLTKTPAGLMDWIATANSLYRGVPITDAWAGVNERVLVYAGEEPDASLVHIGASAITRPIMMAELLKYSQAIVKEHPRGLKAAAAFMSIGKFYIHGLCDGNGRETRRLWSVVAEGIDATKETRHKYEHLLTENTGNALVSPRMVAPALAELHAGAITQALVDELQIGSMPKGIIMPQMTEFAGEAPDRLAVLQEFHTRVSDVTYGIPTMLSFLLKQNWAAERFVDTYGMLHADGLARRLQADDQLDLLIVAEELKKDFLATLYECMQDDETSIFGPSEEVIRVLEYSGTALVAGAVVMRHEAGGH